MHPCLKRHCNYKAKRASSLKKHLANIHNIGVEFHSCGEIDCQYKAKQASHLRRHRANIHNIGKVGSSKFSSSSYKPNAPKKAAKSSSSSSLLASLTRSKSAASSTSKKRSFSDANVDDDDTTVTDAYVINDDDFSDTSNDVVNEEADVMSVGDTNLENDRKKSNVREEPHLCTEAGCNFNARTERDLLYHLVDVHDYI